MKTRILAIILSVCLVGALAWGFTNYKEVGELKYFVIQLQELIQDQNQQLQHASEENDRLERQVGSLSESLGEWEAAYNGLLEDHNQLTERLKNWETAYNDLLADYNQLTEQLNNPDYLQYLLQLLLF